MSDQSKSRRNAHRNTSRAAAVRRWLNGTPKTARDERNQLVAKLTQAEARLRRECWNEATIYTKAQIAARYPDGYVMPVIWPIFTAQVRHL